MILCHFSKHCGVFRFLGVSVTISNALRLFGLFTVFPNCTRKMYFEVYPCFLCSICPVIFVCYCVRDAMTADAGAGVGIVTVDPVFVGTTNVVADSKEYPAGGGCEIEVSECSASKV